MTNEYEYEYAIQYGRWDDATGEIIWSPINVHDVCGSRESADKQYYRWAENPLEITLTTRYLGSKQSQWIKDAKKKIDDHFASKCRIVKRPASDEWSAA